MLMALDRYLEDPNNGITEWPRWPDLLQCPLETVADHPWSHRSQPSQDGGAVLAATEDSQMDREEEVTDAVDKGKGREYEVSNDEVSSSQAAGGEEVRGSRCGGSQSVDLGWSNNPNTTPTKDYENVRVVVYLHSVQRGCAEEGERGSTPTG